MCIIYGSGLYCSPRLLIFFRRYLILTTAILYPLLTPNQYSHGTNQPQCCPVWHSVNSWFYWPLAWYKPHLQWLSIAWTKWTVILCDSLSQTIKFSSLQNQIVTRSKDHRTKCPLIIKAPASEQPCTLATFLLGISVYEKQWAVMVKSMDSGAKPPGSRPGSSAHSCVLLQRPFAQSAQWGP